MITAVVANENKPTLFGIQPGLNPWLDKTPEPPDWIVEDLIHQGTIAILDGLGGSGKSYLAMQLAISIASGNRFLRFATTQGRVLYMNGEDPDSESHRRFRRMIDTMSEFYTEDQIQQIAENITYISMTSVQYSPILLNPRMQPTQTYAKIQKFVHDWKPDIVILDPLSLFVAIENDNSYAAQFYALLRKLDTTILVLHHQSKSGMNGEASERARARGASVWVENARTRMILNENQLKIEKNNYSNKGKYSIPLVFRDGMWWETSEKVAMISEKQEQNKSETKKRRGPKPKTMKGGYEDYELVEIM
jgi:RecA-family ATPase